MPKPKVMPVIPEYTDFPILEELGFKELVERRRGWDVQEKEAKAGKEATGTEIQMYLTVAGIKHAKVGTLVALIGSGKTARTLSPQKLIEMGVDPDVIKQCWVGGRSYTYGQVRAPGELEEGAPNEDGH